jgi:hypothetical protein
MTMVMSILGWIALLAFAVCLGAMFYTYYAAKRLVGAAAMDTSSEASLLAEAESVLHKSARARIRWLKTTLGRLPGGINSRATRVLLVDKICQVAFWIIVASWVLSMLVKVVL